MIANRYELGEIVGTGGMSEVYAANDTFLGREVAIKMLRPDLARDETFRERFRKEAKNSSKLNHPAIVAVFDTGETTRGDVSTPFIVMELVQGRTLRQCITEDGPMTPTQAASVLIPVCEALQVSHEAGIIHRDIKPANIMITNTGNVKIMDFGIARALNDATSAMTQTSAVIGTAQYLSPEQARGKSADARSDVYALGCVLYELVTGRPPFEGESPFAVAYQHVQEDPVAPSEFIADLSPTAALNVDAVVLTAMAKHPGDRYQSAAEMAEELGRLERNAVTQAARHYVQPADPTPTEVVALPQELTQVAPQDSPQSEPQNVAHEPQHRAPEPEKSRWKKVAAAVLAVVVLSVGGAVAFDYTRSSLSSAREVTVPSLAKKQQTKAVKELEDLGLQVAVNEEPNPTIERGLVIRTNPAAGSSVQPGSSITVTVSSGKEVTEVPDLSGKTPEDAQKILDEVGLKLETAVREDSSETVEEGEIMEQNPSAGSQVSKGTRVVITVSTGKPTVRVPAITGTRWEQAEGNLTSLGFVPQVTTVDSAEPAGTVVGVSHEGQLAPKDSVIEVQVSNGEAFVMPDIGRKSVPEAFVVLQLAGWTGTMEDIHVGEPVKTLSLVDSGRIAEQTTPPGAQLNRGAPVTVRVWEFELRP